MNPQVYVDLVASSLFDKLPKDTQRFILSTMSRPGKTASVGETFTPEGAALEVMGMKALVVMHMVLRLPRPKPTPVREVPKPKKDKQKKPMSMRESPRKHDST